MARNPHGFPIWYELMADDPDAAQTFYGDVIGWFSADSGQAGMDYRVFARPHGDAIAGLLKRPDGAAPARWFVYFGVDDVDAAVAAAQAEGGSVCMPATTVPGVGRLALLSDPQGNSFYVMRREPDETSNAFADSSTGQVPPGHAIWNELTADDQDAAMAFYGKVLGLRHEGGMPMGAWGDYKFVHAGGTCIGASMNAQPDWPRGWQVYFLVDEIDAAAKRLTDAGGSVVQGPDQIPGGGYSLVAADAAGVRFGMVGPRVE
ncbi:VOC family protein [Sphingomonas sp. Y38-1Y]|uniref:VOC family protein n=1 Tax=Sphingomonas sp. Y38-1Y TaxID=3078265 RepID=UPI0028E79E99|nr:VOC family protein [Sphingomonas sp. Y38-1Y]